MSLLEDLKSGKYNIILIGIIFVLIFHQYWCTSNKEPMTNVSNEISAAISRIYKADVEAIRNLADLSKKLQDGGLTLPGNLTVQGQIKSGSEISNNSFSLSGLNNKIDSINSQLSSNINNAINNINSNVNNQISNVNSQLSNKYDKTGGTISGDVNITGHLTGTNFTMNTGGGNRIVTQGGSAQFIANGVYFGDGACHGRRGSFGSCR